MTLIGMAGLTTLIGMASLLTGVAVFEACNFRYKALVAVVASAAVFIVLTGVYS